MSLAPARSTQRTLPVSLLTSSIRTQRFLIFNVRAKRRWIWGSILLTNLKSMVGFRNIAVHEYHPLQLPITVAIIIQHLGDFLAFSSFILIKDASQSSATPDT